jgi:hypothetical protein
VRLFTTELQRFAARRAVRWLVLFALVVIALAMVIAAVNSKEKKTHGFVTSCSAAPVPTNAGQPSVDCTQQLGATNVSDNRFDLRNDLGGAIGGTGVALLLFGVLLGTTFIGADYVGGALPGQLTFEPRRTYLYLVKAVAVAVGATIVTIFLLVVLSAALVGLAQWRGVVGHLDGAWFVRRLADVGRVAAVSGGAAAVGFAVTVMARRSVAAIVGFLALGFIIEPALTASLNIFDGRTPMFALVAIAINDFQGAPEGITSLARSVVVALIWAVGLLVVGGVVFARREVR